MYQLLHNEQHVSIIHSVTNHGSFLKSQLFQSFNVLQLLQTEPHVIQFTHLSIQDPICPTIQDLDPTNNTVLASIRSNRDLSIGQAFPASIGINV